MIYQYTAPYYATCWLYKATRARKNNAFTLHDGGSHFLLTKHAYAPIIVYHRPKTTNGYPWKIRCPDNPSCRISEFRINEGPLYTQPHTWYIHTSTYVHVYLVGKILPLLTLVSLDRSPLVTPILILFTCCFF